MDDGCPICANASCILFIMGIRSSIPLFPILETVKKKTIHNNLLQSSQLSQNGAGESAEVKFSLSPRSPFGSGSQSLSVSPAAIVSSFLLTRNFTPHCISPPRCIHLFEKTLSGEKCKRWTTRHNGTLGRWHTQACYWVSFLDVQNIVFQDNLKSKLRRAELL